MVGTIDYTNPEEHINVGHSEELMTQTTTPSIGEVVSKYGTRLSIVSALATTLLAAGHYKYQDYRAKNAPEIIKEYCDINPAVKELGRAIEHSKKNYLFDFNRNNFKSGAIVSKLEKVQLENAASQNEQLGNLAGLAERLQLRKEQINEVNPGVAEYLARTDKVSGYVMMGQAFLLQMAGLGCTMFAIPYVFSHLKRRKEKKKAQSLVEVCKEKGIPPLKNQSN